MSGYPPSNDDPTLPGTYLSTGGDSSFGEDLRGIAAAPAVPVSRAPLPAGATIADKYIVESQLGAGGMGVVYLVQDIQLNRRVAVKLHRVGDTGTERMLLEARAMAQLSHRNVVVVHEVGTHEGQLFIAMEYVHGGSLRSWVADRKPRWRKIVRLFVDAGHGLAAAHDVGIIHRDFKPDNVLLEVDARGRVQRTCVADFGLAKPVTASGPAPVDTPIEQLTASGAVMGTPAYMAPEQIAGGTVGPAADQFAFCVALYEALNGVRPFPGRTLPEIFTRIQSADIRAGLASRRVPDRVAKVVRRGLAYQPEQRYPNIRALIADLEAALTFGRNLAIGGGAVVGAAAIAGVTALFVGDAPCDDAAEDLHDVWSDARADELARIFAEADADDAWADARRRVDAYVDAWLDAREVACEAALAGETVSPARLSCLEQRRDALAAALAVLAEASPAIAQRADDVVAGLPRIEACTEADELRVAPAPAPDDEADAVQAIRSRVAEADALRRAGKYDEAKAAAEAAAEQAETVSFVAVRAEARHVLGETLADLGAYADAQPSLEGAVAAAQASGHEEVLSKAAQRLGYVVGVRLGLVADGERWLERAEASVQRRGNPPADVADLSALRGTLLLTRGEVVPARSEFERALATRREAKLPDDDRTAAYLTNLGAAYIQSGLAEEGRERLAEAYEVRKRTLAKGHPRLVATAVNLAQAMTRTGDEEDAVRLLRGVVDGGGLAKDHPKMVTLLLALGQAKAEAVIMGDPKEEFRAALALAAAVLPKDSPTHVDVHRALGHHYSNWGDAKQARTHFINAVAAAERAHGPESKIVAKVLRNLAEAEFMLGMNDASAEHERRAAKIDGGGPKPTIELKLTPAEFEKVMQKNDGVLVAPPSKAK